MSQAIETAIHEGVATVTLNRPQAYNTLDVAMLDHLPEILSRLAADAKVRVVVLTGAGDKAFCAGGDISGMAGEGATADRDLLVRKLEASAQASLYLHEMPKPTLAAINGVAAGAGMALALACDLRIASAQASFTTAFAKLAMSGDFGGSYFLTQLVGTAKARELYYLSERIDAAEALRLHMVNRLVPHADLRGETAKLAQRLTVMPAITYGNMKRNLNAALTEGPASVIHQEAGRMIDTAMSEETRDAVAAFFAGREGPGDDVL